MAGTLAQHTPVSSSLASAFVAGRIYLLVPSSRTFRPLPLSSPNVSDGHIREAFDVAIGEA